jgi:hypothetical protein
MPVLPPSPGLGVTSSGPGTLVGDLILAIREAVTDMPPTLGLPVIVSATPYTDPNGLIPPAANYFILVTQLNPWGESLPSVEFPVPMVAPNNAIALVISGSQGASLPGGLSSYRIYLGYATGQENFWVTASQSSFNMLSIAPNTGGLPPQRSTAYFPDSDGDAISAYSMFRWLNDALKLASQVCGGLLDYSGVGSVSGQPQYIARGLWKKIESMWYDGYPLSMDSNGNYFRRNAITASVLSSVATSTFNNQMMLELWPQPSRTAASTILAAALNIGDTQAILASSAGFLLSNGFAQIGNEIVSYSGLTGNILRNLQRGLSGTVQAAVPLGTGVEELNLFWSGFRAYNPNFQPGSSLQVVPVPVGWESVLFEYGLGRAKLAEQNVGDYSKLNESCKKQFGDLFRSNKVTTGPRQIGDQSQGLETLPNLGGGWVIP